MPSVLMLLTGARQWTLKDGTAHPTGYWAEEFVAADRVLRDAGFDVTIATPGARPPVADELSLSLEMNGGDSVRVAGLRSYLDDAAGRLAAPIALETVDPAAFDAVFIPGGHGPMEDLAVDATVGRLLVAMLEDRIVASVCHGPASFLSALHPDGRSLFAGRRLTAFTDAEETAVGLAANAPWLLESRLREAGATFEAGPLWAPYVVVDGNLITGQNPASAEQAALALAAMLRPELLAVAP